MTVTARPGPGVRSEPGHGVDVVATEVSDPDGGDSSLRTGPSCSSVSGLPWPRSPWSSFSPRAQAPSLAPQVNAVVPFGVFHDLRWLSVYASSWWTFGALAGGVIVVRGALTAAERPTGVAHGDDATTDVEVVGAGCGRHRPGRTIPGAERDTPLRSGRGPGVMALLGRRAPGPRRGPGDPSGRRDERMVAPGHTAAGLGVGGSEFRGFDRGGGGDRRGALLGQLPRRGGVGPVQRPSLGGDGGCRRRTPTPASESSRQCPSPWRSWWRSSPSAV